MKTAVVFMLGWAASWLSGRAALAYWRHQWDVDEGKAVGRVREQVLGKMSYDSLQKFKRALDAEMKTRQP